MISFVQGRWLEAAIGLTAMHAKLEQRQVVYESLSVYSENMTVVEKFERKRRLLSLSLGLSWLILTPVVSGFIPLSSDLILWATTIGGVSLGLFGILLVVNYRCPNCGQKQIRYGHGGNRLGILWNPQACFRCGERLAAPK
jgi:hypothetical protein